MTVVGLEHVLKQLDLEAIVSQGRVGSAIDKLDRLLPGLGSIARKNAAPGILAGLDAIGKRTTLEGKPAIDRAAALCRRPGDARARFRSAASPPLF